MKLPQPDKYGNYYFGTKGDGPAIFPSKTLVNEETKEIKADGSYFLFLGRVRGFLFDGPNLKRYNNLEDAASELEAQLGAT